MYSPLSVIQARANKLLPNALLWLKGDSDLVRARALAAAQDETESVVNELCDEFSREGAYRICVEAAYTDLLTVSMGFAALAMRALNATQAVIAGVTNQSSIEDFRALNERMEEASQALSTWIAEHRHDLEDLDRINSDLAEIESQVKESENVSHDHSS